MTKKFRCYVCHRGFGFYDCVGLHAAGLDIILCWDCLKVFRAEMSAAVILVQDGLQDRFRSIFGGK